MKVLLLVIGVIILGGGYFYFMEQDTTTPGTPVEENRSMSESAEMDEKETSDSSVEEDTTSSAVESESEIEMESEVVIDPLPVATTKTFNLAGSNFAFDIKEIRVKEGDTVTINFTSVGGFHDWVVDEFGAATAKVQTDGETSVTFVADKKGTFEYYCSVGSHRANGMVGTLIVE